MSEEEDAKRIITVYSVKLRNLKYSGNPKPKVTFGRWDEADEEITKPRWTTLKPAFGLNCQWNFLEPPVLDLPSWVDTFAFYVWTPNPESERFKDTFLGRAFLDVSVYEEDEHKKAKRYKKVLKLGEREEYNKGGFDGVSQEDSVGPKSEIEVEFSVKFGIPPPRDEKGAIIKPKRNVKLLAMYKYKPKKTDELAFRKGQILTLVRKDEDGAKNKGWWVAELDGKKGLVPSNYFKEM